MELVRKWIQCEPKAGAVIYICLKEAIQIAFTENVEVHFVHNARLFRINPHDIVDYLYNHLTEEP